MGPVRVRLGDGTLIVPTLLSNKDKLINLVMLVCNHHKFNSEDIDEALHYALQDPILSVPCFKQLARQAGIFYEK